MFKSGLSENARKRITILKNSNDGFKIAEDDLRIRGYGDILGFKQSGLKKFHLADPIQHEDLFKTAEKEIKNISGTKIDYVGIKTATAIDFRGDNMTNFESLEKNSIDLYAATKSLYLQNRDKKINNSSESDDDDWGNLDN